MDLLEFIETKMLRLTPKKRSECQEIVDKFSELHKICLADPNYCTKRLKKPPNRAGTNLSLLQASALDLSPAMDKLINRTILPEHTGPLESDHQTPEPEPSRMDTITEARTPTPTTVVKRFNTKVAATESIASSDSESLSSRPQSPNRKVHFPAKLHSPSQDSFRLHPKPSKREEGKEMEQENSIHPDPPLPGPLKLASASASTIATDPEKAPQADPESTNISAEGSELGTAQASKEQTTGENISSTEPTSTADEVVKGAMHKPMDTGSANGAAAIQKKEKKNSKGWKHFFRGFCCFHVGD
jgi:hypothetical protein